MRASSPDYIFLACVRGPGHDINVAVTASNVKYTIRPSSRSPGRRPARRPSPNDARLHAGPRMPASHIRRQTSIRLRACFTTDAVRIFVRPCGDAPTVRSASSSASWSITGRQTGGQPRPCAGIPASQRAGSSSRSRPPRAAGLRGPARPAFRKSPESRRSNHLPIRPAAARASGSGVCGSRPGEIRETRAGARHTAWRRPRKSCPEQFTHRVGQL